MSDSKINVLIHPARLRIASVFGARGLTTKQIADALPDIPQGSLYRHIKKMVDVGILEVAEERPIKGVMERVYRLNYKAALLNANDVKSASTESLKDYYITLVVDLMREINECIDMPDFNIETHGPKFLKTYRFTNTEGRTKIVEKFFKMLNENCGSETSEDKKRTMITLAVMPVPEPESGSEE